MTQPSPTRPKLARPDWLIRIGRRLQLARGRAGLTQQRLAAPDLSKSFISLLESARSYPSVETIIALAERVNSSVASLLMDPPDLRLETAFNLLHIAMSMDLDTRGPEAARYIDVAEVILPDLPVELRIRGALLRARIAIAGHQLGDAVRWAEEATDMARRHRLSHRLGMALALKGEVEVRRRTYAAAAPLLEHAVSLMMRARSGRTEENVRALISLGTTYMQLGRTDAARRTYKRAEELATRVSLHALRGKALSGLGMAEWARRRFDAAAEYLGEARDAFERVEDLAEMSRVLTNLGVVRREQGRYQEALRALEQTLRIKERLNDGGGRSAALDEMAQVWLAMDRPADAARAARRAVREAQAAGDRMREADAQVTLGRVLQAQGRAREAVQFYRGALATFKRLGLKGRATAAADAVAAMLNESRSDGAATPSRKRTGSSGQAPRPELLESAERLPG